MTKHCKTCTCTVEPGEVLTYFADLDVSDVPVGSLEEVMEHLRGMGFPRLHLGIIGRESFIRCFWTVGGDEGSFVNLWELFQEITGIQSYLHAWTYNEFSDPSLCAHIDVNCDQYVYSD